MANHPPIAYVARQLPCRLRGSIYSFRCAPPIERPCSNGDRLRAWRPAVTRHTSVLAQPVSGRPRLLPRMPKSGQRSVRRQLANDRRSQLHVELLGQACNNVAEFGKSYKISNG